MEQRSNWLKRDIAGEGFSFMDAVIEGTRTAARITSQMTMEPASTCGGYGTTVVEGF